MTSKESYSLLFFLIQCFSNRKSFKKLILTNKNYVLKNIDKNETYIKNKYTFDGLSSKYLNKDIIMIFIGFMLTEKNINMYSFSYNKIKDYYKNCRFFIANSKKIIENEINIIKNSCNLDKDILYLNKQNIKESKIYKLYETYNHLTISYIYYNLLSLDEFKKIVKEDTNSLILEMFYNDIYKNYRLIEILKKLKVF